MQTKLHASETKSSPSHVDVVYPYLTTDGGSVARLVSSPRPLQRRSFSLSQVNSLNSEGRGCVNKNELCTLSASGLSVGRG